MKLALAPICAALTAGGCKRVAGLLEFAAERNAPAAVPAFYVVPTDEDASPNRLSGGRDQKVACRFMVLVLLDAARRNADAIADDLRAETERAKAALVGWTHPEASGPVDFAGGRLVSADAGRIVWGLRFSTAYHLRKAS